MAKKNPFITWLHTINPRELAPVLGVSFQAIYLWRTRKAFPHPAMALRLVKASKSQFDLGDIYSQTQRG